MANERRAGGLKIDIGMNVANLAKDVGKATSTLTKLEKDIGKIGKNISTAFKAALAITGVTVAVAGVKKLSDALVDLADIGDKAGDISENFKKLGGESVSIDDARKRILGVVDSFDLMQIANSGLLKQVPGINENFALMAEYGNKLADTLGEDVAPKIQQVVDAFAKGKEKGFLEVGLLVDADKAYAQYAKQIGLTVKQLDDAQKKEARQLEALRLLNAENAKRADLGISVTQANERIGESIDEATKKVGIAINENENLAKAYNKIADAIDAVDWSSVGDDVADFLAKVSNAVATAVSELEGYIRTFKVLKAMVSENLSFDQAVGAVQQSEMLEDQLKASQQAKKAIDTLKGIDVFSGDKLILDYAGLQKAKGAVEDLEGAFATGNVTIKDADKILAGAKKTIEDYGFLVDKTTPKIKNTGLGVSALADKQKEAAKAAEELTKANENFDSSLKDLLGIDSLPGVSKELRAVFDDFNLQQKTAKETEDAIKKLSLQYRMSPESIKQFQESMKGAADSSKDATQAYNKNIEEMLRLKDEYEKDVADAKKGGSIFGGLFDDLFSDDAGNSGTPEAISKGRDFGEQMGAAVAQGLSDGILLLLEGGNGTEYRAALSKTIFDGLAAAAGEFGPFVQAVEPVFGKALEHVFGGEHAGTTARKSADAFFADAFDANRLGIIINNQLVRVKDLVFKGNTLFGGDSQFTNGSFGNFFDTLPAQVQAGFAGVGAGLEEILGLTDDISGQIAAVLANNIGDSLNNLQLLVQSTGKSFEELREGVIKSFDSGKLDFVQTQTALNGIAQVAQDGIPDGLGLSIQAFKNLQAAGTKGGRVSIDALKDIAHEAKELKLQDFPALIKQLLSTGELSADQVALLFQTLEQHGIKSIEQLATATTEQLIPVLSGLQTAGFDFAEGEADLDEISEKLRGIDEHLKKELEINVKTNFDENTKEAMRKGAFNDTELDNFGETEAYATGAIINKATFIRPGKLAGEAGAEGLLPLGNVNGKLGVHFKDGGRGKFGNVSIVVNAPGGDGPDILEALHLAEEQIVNRTVNIILDAADRGTYGGGL